MVAAVEEFRAETGFTARSFIDRVNPVEGFPGSFGREQAVGPPVQEEERLGT